MNTAAVSQQKQPKVFLLAIISASLERFGFYILAYLLLLYTKIVFNYSDHDAFLLYGVFTALIFLTPAIGGYLADNIIGIKRSIMLGLFFEATGLALLAMPSKFFFLLSLAVMVIGIGFFRTGPTVLMARAYKENDPRIDSGFTWYYMAINIGSFFSPILAGILQRLYGWNFAFLLAAAVVYCNIFCSFLMRHRANGLGVDAGKISISARKWLFILIGIIFAIGISFVLLSYNSIANTVFFTITAMVLLYFANAIRNSPKDEKQEIIACILLIFIGMMFFVMFFQYFMSITLFIQRSVNHHAFGFDIPTTFFLSLDALWIIILSPLLVFIYNRLGKHNKDLAITTKFAYGLLMISLCFIVLKISTLFPDIKGQISGLWMIFAIMLFALGELLISALGVAMVARIAPKRMYGVMMGAWFLISTALGSAIASQVASLSAIPKTMTDPLHIIHIYGHVFLMLGMTGIVVTIITFIVGPYIKKIAHI